MPSGRLLAATTVLFGTTVILHAAFTWPAAGTLVFFGAGSFLAFVAEAVVVDRGWLVHRVGRSVLGVPLYALVGWTGVMYVALRVALVITEGWAAVPIAAVLATTADGLVDYRGVAAGYWAYTDDLPGPRYRGVPWWNYTGWLVITSITAAITVGVL